MFVRLELHTPTIPIHRRLDCQTFASISVSAWSNDEKQTNSVLRLHHSPYKQGFSELQVPYANVTESDAYVTFKSTVGLEDWKAILKQSGYDEPNNHHLFKHNCAHGAAFALEAAGINAFSHRSYVVLNRGVYPGFPSIRFPFFTLTPHDLYYFAKDYKIKQLKDQESNYLDAALRVKLLTTGAPSEEKKIVTKIIDGIQKRHETFPEHTEAQIDILMRTYQFVTCMPTREECLAYINSSEQFKQRDWSKAGKFQNNLFTVTFIATCLISYYFSNPFSSNDLIKTTRELASTYLTYKCFSTLFQPSSFYRIVKDTELSQSMRQLSFLKLPSSSS